MVDVMGHLAFGLLFALPAWFVWSGRTSVGFLTVMVVVHVSIAYLTTPADHRHRLLPL
ncbi:hypothetical protein [Halobellus salinisoli]|uniref:hypothetical protein n=1 Tax=Halobellus salinisoli TaxID=3108500 RepID=UPI00300985F5